MPNCPVGVGNRLDVPKKHCHGCGEPLQGFKRTWCSEACERRYWRNHAWGPARWYAIHLASVHEPMPADWSEYGHTFGPIIWTICDDCGGPAEGIEVNHVDPRLGQGYGVGCHNHQTNLQVLCHGCHVLETTRQRRERLGPPKAKPVKPPEPTSPIWADGAT